MARFLVDEDLPRSLKRTLISAGLVAEDVRDVGLKSRPDSDVFAFAVSGGWTIVTKDRGFGDVRLYPLGTHHGIVVVRYPNLMPVPQLNAAILVALRMLGDDDIIGHVVILQPGKLRIRGKP
jgi:predicted nuclease of predicted toxin-antitoxin system